MKQIDTVMTIPGFFGRPATFRIRLYRERGRRPVAIIEEAKAGAWEAFRGAAGQIASYFLATQINALYRLPLPERLRWIEQRSTATRTRFEEVNLAPPIVMGVQNLANLPRMPLTRAAVESLIGVPPTPRPTPAAKRGVRQSLHVGR